MKIIKQGDENKRVRKDVEFVCEECGCMFLAEGNDYCLEKRYLRGQSFQVEHTFATTICPNCTKLCEKEIFNSIY